MVRCEHCEGEHEEQSRFCPATGRLFAPQRFFPPGTLLMRVLHAVCCDEVQAPWCAAARAG